jgi:hypothetical protein
MYSLALGKVRSEPRAGNPAEKTYPEAGFRAKQFGEIYRLLPRLRLKGYAEVFDCRGSETRRRNNLEASVFAPKGLRRDRQSQGLSD